jgi:hypothetical protein
MDIITPGLSTFKTQLQEYDIDMRYDIITNKTTNELATNDDPIGLLYQFRAQLNQFLNELYDYTDQSITVHIYKGYYRCLARIYDQQSHKPDINKRCRSGSLKNYDLCNCHMTKEKVPAWCGRVTEYPNEYTIIRPYFKRGYYKNNIIKQREFNNNINLSHELLCKKSLLYSISTGTITNNIVIHINIHKNKNLKLKTNIMYNSKMSLESGIIELDNTNEFYDNLELYNISKEQYTDKIEQYVKSKYDLMSVFPTKLNTKQPAKEILQQLSICTPTQRECNIVEQDIIDTFQKTKVEKQYEQYCEKIRLDFIKTVDIYSFDSIRFIDNDYNGYELYYHSINGTNTLYNSNRKMIGYIRDWIDDEDEVPIEFKTIDNKVLHPLSKLPVLEVEITSKGSGFEPIDKGIYREFEYIDHLETLCNTNQIIRNS